MEAYYVEQVEHAEKQLLKINNKDHQKEVHGGGKDGAIYRQSSNEAPSKEVPNLKSLYRIHDTAKLATDLHTTCSDNLQHIFRAQQHLRIFQCND